MVYRDADLDVRSADLVAVVATYAPLLEDQRQIRQERDDLLVCIAELADRLAQLEHALDPGSVLAAVKHWIGRAPRDEVQREAAAAREALARHTERLAQLDTRAQTIAARLTTIEAARAELVRREEARADALRAAEGPSAVELRKIDQDAAATDARIDAIARAHAAADRAREAMAEIRAVHAACVEAIRSSGPIAPAQLDRARARLREHLMVARSELHQFADAFAVLQVTLEPPARLALAEMAAVIAAPIAEPPEHSALVASLDATLGCTARLLAMVGGALHEQRRRRATLTDQQRALGRGTGGGPPASPGEPVAPGRPPGDKPA